MLLSSFTKDPALRQLPTGEWQLLEGFVYHIGEVGSGKYIEIRKGFKTDFATIPRLLWPIFSPTDYRYLKAAILHDYMIRGNVVYHKWGPRIVRKQYTREQAANVFFEAMRCNEKNPTPLWIALLFYLAVRAYDIFISPFR